MAAILGRIIVSGIVVVAASFPGVALAQSEVRRTPLEQTYWKVIELGGKPVAAPDASREASIVLQDRRVTGSDGCNRITGSYTVSGGDVTFGQIAETRMACPNSAGTERAFRDALGAASRLTVASGRLTLFDASGAKVAVFEAGAPPSPPKATPPPPPKPVASSPLNGTGWQLVKFQGGDGRIIAPAVKGMYAFELATGGRLRARVDCNRGTGTWTSSGPSQVQFGPLALSTARCPAGSMHDQIVKDFPNIRSYAIRSGHLFLSLMADGGTYEFEPLTPAAESKP